MKAAWYYFLLILVLLSLVLNGVILVGLWFTRQAIVEALDVSLETMARLQDERFETEVHIQDTVPVQANVPFEKRLTVPIELVVPIEDEITFEETLQIPINTIVGEYRVRVPVSATIPISLSVPVNTEVPVTISESLPISTEVAIDMTVPVVIRIADTPLVAYLEALRLTLVEVRRQLSFGQE